MIAPAANRPAVSGSSRIFLGFRSSRSWVPTKNTSAVNSIASGRVGMSPASSAAPKEPASMPGASARAIRQSTAPCAWCARMLERDVKTMVAIDVPSATCNRCSGGRRCAVKTKTSIGTLSAPPPIPSKPARKPAIKPIAR
jgi:hypothetical protein